MNWGIISAANIAFDEVVPAIRRSANSKPYALATKTKEKAQRFQIDNVYATYGDLLADEHVTSVYIPLPNALHHDMVIKSLKSYKNVLVEKPATISLEEMKQIAATIQETGHYFLEGFMYQYHKQHKKMRELLPLIGDIVHIKSHFSWLLENEQDIRLNSALGGGAMYDVGCYCMHAITQLIGFKPAVISMVSNTLSETDVDRTSVCTMFDKHGKMATFTCSMEMPFLDYYEIIGEQGLLKVSHSFRPDVSKSGVGIVERYNNAGDLLEQHKIQDDQYLRQIEHFEQQVDSKVSSEKNLQQSLEMSHYLEQAYKSAYKNGEFIRVEDIYYA
ncbi:Gfo/Idh/MocA family oxidoreductase [Lysinibacillus capsici]|uniref:Gfo/Idh/MocA family protein n=2 Tax=Lysinibacillus capsici TaxID=2115968 RepID=UPI0001DA4C40|nr:Gfo/Idh/MocA family oxidoreductase [Lysinibacillus capsici]EFI66575.1 oxidoreductase [Lysinibacillus fusiformis ZC1]MED4697737.1 Gfo/Idh/MocA family oxidoreductase [Lysinibacillus capsici]